MDKPTPPTDPEFRPSWTNRRRTLFATLAFCALVIAYIMVWGGDTRVNETIVQFAFITAGGCVGSYIFGATWQDVTRLRK